MNYVGIDPSTKTGLVILNEAGEVKQAIEITKDGQDPARMVKLVDEVMSHLLTDDEVCIEGYAYGAKGKGISVQYGLGAMFREWLYRNKIIYHEVAPSALKKFAGCKGNAKKDELAVEIFKRTGFEHKSDNVRDAYVLARIARALHEPIKMIAAQQEVINVIANPPIKKNKKVKES